MGLVSFIIFSCCLLVRCHVSERMLSDHDHQLGDDHNTEFDHDLFLGKDEAKTFHQLSRDESRDRLSLIVDKIDKDGNKSVTLSELKDWIYNVRRKYIIRDAYRIWKYYGDPEMQNMTFQFYHRRTFGFDEGDEEKGTDKNRKQARRDKLRWQVADRNKDGLLTKGEFIGFLHPEDFDYMEETLAQEYLDDLDTNKDGYVNLDEYIADMAARYHKSTDGTDSEWVERQKRSFENHKDKNKDGKLDKEEVKDWIQPTDFDFAETEAAHLIRSADTNQDGVLTKEEFLEHQDLFVGTGVTNFGDMIHHDEF